MTLLSFIAEALWLWSFSLPSQPVPWPYPSCYCRGWFSVEVGPTCEQVQAQTEHTCCMWKDIPRQIQKQPYCQACAHLLVSHLGQTKPYRDFFGVSGHGRRDEAAGVMQWHTGGQHPCL